MKYLNILFLLFSFFFSEAQQHFVASRASVFSKSIDQWMCKELRRQVPTQFSCSPFFQNYKPKVPESLTTAFKMEMDRTRASKGDFLKSYFGEMDCTVFLTLKSLCDLYFPLMERKLDQHRLPREYKYLPLVLTGFNPSYTDSLGRSGMWAMEYLVARKEGLRVDSLVDERNGGDFTTDKALSYLEELFQEYNGDHRKVLVAYYKSNAFVKQCLMKAPDDFTLCLDDDSKDFLQYILFTIGLFNEVNTDNQLANYFDVFGSYEGLFFTSNVQLDALREITQADLELMHLVNPVYKGSWIEGTYRKVPFMLAKSSVDIFKSDEAKVYAWKASKPIERPIIYHVVKKGESLGTIAKKHHVTIEQIKKWNHLKKNTIRIGQKLKVGESAISGESDETVDERGGKEELNSENSAPAPFKIQGDKDSIKYKVKSGDSLWIIANKFKGVTPEKIMKWNKCNENIRPGQILEIHLKGE